MSIEKVRAYLAAQGIENRIQEFPVSSATMEGRAMVRMMLVSSPRGLEITMELRSSLSAGRLILS